MQLVGHSGAKLPLFCRDGRPSHADAIKIVHRALDQGVRFIDTADVYCANDSDKHYAERVIKEHRANPHMLN